jgi:hypothetical protein
MERSLKRLLSAKCDEHFAKALPTFRVFTGRGSKLPGRLYVDTAAKPTFFLFFQFGENRDRFTVELAWSVDGEFPMPSDFPMPRDWDEFGLERQDKHVEQFRFRLTKLWRIPKHDPWWSFKPINLPLLRETDFVADQDLSDAEKCDELLSDALKAVTKYGLPYIADIRGRYR